MILPPEPKLDPRAADELTAELLARRLGYVPEWSPSARGPDAAVAPIIARYVQAILQRLNKAPLKNQLAFLEMLGIQLVPAQAARAPMVFRLTANAADSRIPAGTRVAAPPPPETTRQIVFETERATGLAAAKLSQVVSLWPGRDQYIDHTADLAAGQPLRLFNRPQLQNTPHAIYLAHDTLLNMTGKSTINVTFELLRGGSEELDVVWEYFDGDVWREFMAMRPSCDEDEAGKLDSTIGLTQSGRYSLQTDCAQTSKKVVNGIEAFWVRGHLGPTETLPLDPAQILPEVESIQLSADVARPIVGNTGGVALDKAFADELPLDVSKAFMPFGPQPHLGSAFYFSSEEVFSKPGARITILIQTAETQLLPSTTPNPKIAWDFWDGQQWRTLTQTEHAKNLTPSKDIDDIIVHPDMARREINGQDGLWMRARLVSGGFDREVEITAKGATEKKFALISQSPALDDFRLGYSWHYGPYYPEHVLTFNDFQYLDRTEEAIWPGRTFQPFTPLQDTTTPTLYLGFDKALPVDRLGMYLDIAEQRGDTLGPVLQWEYWDGFAWQFLSVEDETRNFRVPGIVSFIGPNDSQPLARFGRGLHWLRARLKEDGPPGEPLVGGIFPNAVWVVQHETVFDEPLGTSNGRANQAFAFRQHPVLPGQRIEVREVAGLRANVEWRLVAAELFGGAAGPIRTLEAELAAEGAQRDVVQGDLRLRRDRAKRVTEVWVRWREQRHLFFSGPADRDYVMDRARGRVSFGDGDRGRVPLPGAAVLARQYLSGGGLAGNVGVRTITQVLGAIGAIEASFNPRAAEGGADGETIEALALRGPQSVRHRGRALLPEDYETMAREASAAVAFARAVPGLDPSGQTAPGWMTLLIIPQSSERRPWPSFGLREHVRRYLADRAPADLAAAGRIYVTGPVYLPVDVDATIAVGDPDEAGVVEARARQALETFLHPVRGGPLGRGWELGRDVFLSDVASVLERVEGVDFVREVALLRDGVAQGERLAVGDERVVVPGLIRLKLLVGEA